MKILIADDSLLDRKLLINLLQKSGITNEILQAADGEEAMKVVAENYQDISLIFLDWQMPKMSGIEFMSAVVKVPNLAHIPIIMITASGSEDSRKLAYDTNPNLAGYLIKPYKTETLIDLVKEHAG